jgi:hypothetical protein
LNGGLFEVAARSWWTPPREASRPYLTAIPTYALASHATELFLKAALLKRGFAERELKQQKYRHNLDALLAELQRKGLPVEDIDRISAGGCARFHSLRSSRSNGAHRGVDRRGVE